MPLAQVNKVFRAQLLIESSHRPSLHARPARARGGGRGGGRPPRGGGGPAVRAITTRACAGSWSSTRRRS